MDKEKLIALLLAEYSYWREVEDPKIQDFAAGAMGAVSNILAGIAKDMTLEQYRDWRNKG